MIIGHIADIHIRLGTRFQEYKDVFEKLYESLKENKVDRIVIAGDLVHNKNILSPELISLTREFLYNLATISPVDIIPGNHDANLKNKNRLDALQPIVDSLESQYKYGIINQISYMNKTGYYVAKNKFGCEFIGNVSNLSYTFEADDIIYCVWSVLDGLALNKLDKKIHEIINYIPKIGLYHGVITGSKLDTGYIFKLSASLDIFNDCNIVMLGDIHKYQSFNNNIKYCGSLIQQNFGESKEKGYILWNITKTNIDSKFIKLENKYGFETLEVNYYDLYNLQKNTELDEFFNLRIICNIKREDVGSLALSNITKKIIEIYKIKPTTIIFRPIDSDKDENFEVDNIINIRNFEVQKDLLKKWYSKNNISNDNINKLIELDETVYNQIILDNIYIKNNYNNWSLDKIKINNFMSFENVELDILKLNGITGLFGNNKTGKSSLIDSILYCLFNKTTRKVKNNELINIYNNSKMCSVELIITIENYNYKIVRKTDKVFKNNVETGSKTELKLFKKLINDEQWAEDNGEQRAITEKMIRSIIGEYDDFLITVVSSQNNFTDLVQSTEAKRIEAINKFLGLDIFEKRYQIVKDLSRVLDIEINKNCNIEEQEQKLNELKTIHINDLNNIENLKNVVNEYTNVIEITIKNIENFKNKIGKIKYDYNDKINTENKINLNKESINFKQIKIDILNENIKATKNIINEYKIIILKHKNIEELKKVCNNEEYNNILKKIRKLQDELILKQAEIKKLEEIAHKKCPVNINKDECQLLKFSTNASQKIELLNCNIDEMKANLSIYNNAIKQFENTFKIIENITLIEQKIVKHESEIKNYKLDLKCLNSEIDNLILSNKMLQSELIIINNNEKILKDNLFNKENINTLEKKLDELRIEKEKSEKIFLECSNRMSVNEEKIKNIKNEYDKLIKNLETKSLYNIYLNSTSKYGVPLETIKLYIPVINYFINNALSVATNFGVFFNIDENNYIDIIMRYGNDYNDARSITLGSGMEKLLASIAIRSALLQISCLPKPSTWFIDEGFGTLDSNEIFNLQKLLEYFRTKFKNMIIITHIDIIKDMVDLIITVEKDAVNTPSRLILPN